MKKILAKVDFWNLFIGLVVGIGLGVVVFTSLVPSGREAIMYYKWDKENGINKTLQVENSVRNHEYNAKTYLLGSVESEKEYLSRMKVHHETSIAMSQQMLGLDPRPEVATLAKQIITDESSELKMITDFLSAWYK